MKLPKYYYFEKLPTKNHPITQWFNKKYNKNYNGSQSRYYGYDGNTNGGATLATSNIGEFINSPTFLTHEELLEIIKDEEFVLPEKWCVSLKNAGKELMEYINKNGMYPPYSSQSTHSLYAHFPSKDGCTTFSRPQAGYVLLTQEQFLNYILKQETMENKTIIGYKLIKPEYEEAAVRLIAPHTEYKHAIKFSDFPGPKLNDRTFTSTAMAANHLRNAGVLDLWFEPVYGPKEVKLMLKGSNKNVEITIKEKGWFHVDGKKIQLAVLENVIEHMRILSSYNDWEVVPRIDVGCVHGLTVNSLNYIVAEHNKLFKL
jgi:hypothetical protein